jgi:hypothetical protein
MANLPVRDLGGIGVITDSNPYDLPSNAFSDGRNVVFDSGRVSRSPVFKKLFPTPTSSITFADVTGTFASTTDTFENAQGGPTSAIRFVASYSDPSAGEVTLLADNNGTVRTYPNGLLQFATPGAGLITNEENWTHAQISGISFLARKGMVPYGRKIVSDTNYSLVSTSDWGASDTCSIIRAYLDFVLALNVTKGAVDYPTMVKWSNPVPYGTTVAGLVWDPSNPANVAGENILGELTTPILDGLVLGSQFIIYSLSQVYLMEYTGSSLVFNFRRLFPTGGIINTNCVVEVEGKHFVFGDDDIYMHDGTNKRSIADGKVRKKIYTSIRRNDRARCFVVHDSVNNFVKFCYKSVENDVAFPNTSFANKAALYNYRNDTWSFVDLPNIAGGSEVSFNINTGLYSGTANGYSSYNSSYQSFAADSSKLPAMVGVTDVTNGLTESRLYGYDLPTIGRVSIPPEPETFVEAFVERIGLDLDDSGLELRAYKQVKSIIPQAEFEASDGILTFQVGSSDLPLQAVSWSTSYDYRPDVDYKIDTRANGRYLAYRVSLNEIENFKFSGFDAEVLSLSRR